MIASNCSHTETQKYGKTKSGAARLRCKLCGKTFTESTNLLGGMRIGLDRAEQLIGMLCEGMSVSAVARLTDTDPHTIIDLMMMVGERCEAYMQENIRGVHVDDVQCDEIWQYVYCKQATATQKKIVGGCGDSWCWTAIERHTKLLVTWHHGRRTMEDSGSFMRKLAVATAGRFHLSTDGYATYEPTVAWHLGQRVDYGQIIKVFGGTSKDEQRKYSPAKIIGTKRSTVLGRPNRDQICTSHSERMNGSIRNFVKRMGRLTYCFSKRWDNHRAALGLFFAQYNYCRKHRSLRGQTPAMAHGLTTEVWTIGKLIREVMANT